MKKKCLLQNMRISHPSWVLEALCIPHICHFFYTGRIFENQILYPKKQLKAPKTLKMSLKKSNICILFTQSGKVYTWQIWGRVILIQKSFLDQIVHVPKLFSLLHWSQNIFCFLCSSTPSHGDKKFSASMGISIGKWPKLIKWPKITFPGSKMVPKVAK